MNRVYSTISTSSRYLGSGASHTLEHWRNTPSKVYVGVLELSMLLIIVGMAAWIRSHLVCFTDNLLPAIDVMLAVAIIDLVTEIVIIPTSTTTAWKSRWMNPPIVRTMFCIVLTVPTTIFVWLRGMNEKLPKYEDTPFHKVLFTLPMDGRLWQAVIFMMFITPMVMGAEMAFRVKEMEKAREHPNSTVPPDLRNALRHVALLGDGERQVRFQVDGAGEPLRMPPTIRTRQQARAAQAARRSPHVRQPTQTFELHELQTFTPAVQTFTPAAVTGQREVLSTWYAS